MLNIYSLLKAYIITSILWFVFMLNIITIRLINDENVNDVFGISLVDTTLYVFLSITFIFILTVINSNKIYIHNNKFHLV